MMHLLEVGVDFIDSVATASTLLSDYGQHWHPGNVINDLNMCV